MDIWLARGSHIAQVGLFILTIAALYFTVIPLYKTAALEEQIARREAELKEAETKLATAQEAVRKADDQIYRRSRAELVRRLAMKGPVCSGFLTGVRPSKLEERPSLPPAAREFDAGACLVRELETLEPAALLTKADYQRLDERVRQLAGKLESRRQELLLTIATLERKSTSELVALAPLGYFERMSQQNAAEARRRAAEVGVHVSEPSPASIHSRAVDRAATRLDFAYREEVHDAIAELVKFDWPDGSLAPSAPVR